MEKVYLDNGATTKVDKEVVDSMIPFFCEKYGNPSSLHSFGEEAFDVVSESRKIILDALGSKSVDDKIIFTGSATEANNLGIIGFANANKNRGKHIITTKIEHNAIINPCKQLERDGFRVTYLGVDKDGMLDLEDIKSAICEETILVSVIHSNHEVGTIADLKGIGEICLNSGVVFHSDCAQSFTKAELDVNKFNLGMVSLNAHKMHGPKGVGCLYVKEGVKIGACTFGGGQESGLRSGTENVALIVGFAKSVEVGVLNMKRNVSQMVKLRDYMIDELLKISNTFLNGCIGNNRLCNNVNVSFDFVEGEAMLLHLNLLGICVSTGSACSSKSLAISPVLKAMGRMPAQAHGSLRFTLSKYTTKKEVDFVVENVKSVVAKLRELSPLG